MEQRALRAYSCSGSR